MQNQNRCSKIISFTVASTLVLILGGCTSTKSSLAEAKVFTPRTDMHTKSYKLNVVPIIGSRQDDTKVIMDMGKIMKVWISDYKNRKTFVSSHDNYVVAQDPDFVLGETIPQKNWRSVKTPTNSIPFIFRDADLDKTTKLGREEIIKYNNNVYEQQNTKKVPQERLDEVNIYDREIKSFLEN